MHRILSLIVIALIALLGAACSSDGSDAGGSDAATGGSSTDNLAACRAYLTTYNELPCVSGAAALDAATACPASINDVGCDVSDYYDCLSTSLACMDVGGTSVLDSAGLTACGTGPVCR